MVVNPALKNVEERHQRHGGSTVVEYVEGAVVEIAEELAGSLVRYDGLGNDGSDFLTLAVSYG